LTGDKKPLPSTIEPPGGNRLARVDFFGMPLDLITLADLVDVVDQLVEEGREAEHGCLAPNTLIRASDDPAYAAALRRHRFVTADGQGVVWAARLLGHRVPERVSGADLMLALLERAAKRGFRVYLLGATPEVLAGAEEALRRDYPALVVAGRRDGYFSLDDEDAVVADIAQSNADLLFLALPSPKKEIFVLEHRGELRVSFTVGVGGMFDILAGKIKRAPSWAQRTGFEWAFRVAQEPRRLLGRYLTTNTRFVLRVSGPILRKRLRRPRTSHLS
jgi:N-acetylglucosaminyldiphosphoundecaprenol N-acetyl-beta-D-mannosaminyltransferase